MRMIRMPLKDQNYHFPTYENDQNAPERTKLSLSNMRRIRMLLKDQNYHFPTYVNDQNAPERQKSFSDISE
jgi:hypothetical protein